MLDADRKRELKKAAREAGREAFLKAMPFDPESACRFFDMVDDALEADSCHDDHRYALSACEKLGLSAEAVLPWLKAHGGGCDCEVLANVEECVEEISGGRG